MSTKTTNYQFVKPDGDDLLSPEQYNGNFDTLDSKLKSVEDSVETISDKVSKQGTELTEHSTALSNAQTKLSAHDTAIASANSKLSEHDTKLGELESKIENGKTDDAELTEIRSKLSEHDTKLGEHDTSIAELNEKIKDIDTTPRNIATLAEVLEVLGTVNEPIEPTQPDVPDTTGANIFGVMWDSANGSTALTRLGKDSDPYKLVTQDVDTEPVPAVGTGGGSSPFDSFAPWSEMEKRTLENQYEMVFVPAFWFACKTDGAKKYFYISDKETEGFTKHPGSGKYVGRYVITDNALSASGGAPKVNLTRAAARSTATGAGDKFHLYDFAAHCAIILLYLVEYADWDCQAKIGKGRCKADSVANTGETDAMTYHTGTTTSRDSTTDSVQYHWIENPWGNVCQLVDGFNAKDGVAYYCLEPDKYTDDTVDDYTEIGALPNSNFIKNVTVAKNGLLIPSETGSAETYISDWAQIIKSGMAGLYAGGSRTDDTGAGLMFFNVTPYTGATVSTRLECEP